VEGIPRPIVHLELPEPLCVEDPGRAHALFRCAQEAITNAVRHAEAENLWIEVSEAGGTIALRARDDGRGAADVRVGNGLSGIRERLEALGGRFEVDARPGEGWTLRAFVPARGGPA
jgi:signal transduction histidine kinase